jgi:hypothetical protein
MANYVLLCSSIVMTLVQMLTNFYFRPPIFFCGLGFFAMFTSIWNHGTSNNVAKVLDRMYMIVYIATNSLIIFSVVQSWSSMLMIYGIMATGVVSVIKAMVTRSKARIHQILHPSQLHAPGNGHHIYAHIVVMIVHSLLSYQLTIDCQDDFLFCSNDWFTDWGFESFY